MNSGVHFLIFLEMMGNLNLLDLVLSSVTVIRTFKLIYLFLLANEEGSNAPRNALSGY